MRVCFICSGFSNVHGGAQKQLRKLMSELSKMDVKITLLTRKSLTTTTIPNVNIVLIPDLLPKIRMIGGLSFIFFSICWLIKNRNKIDLIHAIQMYSNTTIAVFAKLFFKIPIVTKITATNELGEVNTIKKLPFYAIRIRLLKHVDFFIAITSQVRKELLTIGLSDNKIISIPNGVASSPLASFKKDEKQKARTKLGLTKNKIALYVGRYSSEKNIDVAIEALSILNSEKLLDDFSFILLGGGGDYRNVEGKLHELIYKHNLQEVVQFAPSVENVYDYLVASDIFVLLSTSEGLSNALLEAMACGCGILATDIDANRDLLTNNVNSLLVKVKDIDGTAEAFKKFLSGNVNSDDFGFRAKQFVEENYTIEVVAQKHLSLYKSLLDKK